MAGRRTYAEGLHFSAYLLLAVVLEIRIRSLAGADLEPKVEGGPEKFEFKSSIPVGNAPATTRRQSLGSKQLVVVGATSDERDSTVTLNLRWPSDHSQLRSHSWRSKQLSGVATPSRRGCVAFLKTN